MEQFWNVIHYFTYKFLNKAYLVLDKISPFTLLLKIPAIEKFLIKRGGSVDMVNQEASNVVTNPILSVNSYYSGVIMISLPVVFCFALQCYYVALISKPEDYRVGFFLVIFYAISSGALNYFLLYRNDKYLKYFKKFEKESHNWKVKWAWISAGVILFPFLVLIGSFITL